MAGRNFRRGKGNGSGDKPTDDTKISNSVSASDGREADVPVPPPPRPVQKRQGGRTDLNAQQGSQLHQQVSPATTPKVSRREQQKIDAMKNAAPAPAVATAAAVPTMGGAASDNPQGYVSPTDEQLKAYARQSVDDYNAGIETADQITWLNDADMARLDDAVAFEMAVDTYRGHVQQAATDLTQVDLNSLSVEGHTVARGGLTYLGDNGLIVVDNGLTKIEPGKEDPRPRLDAVHVQDAIAARESAQQQQVWAETPKSVHEERHAVYFIMGDKRVQFSESSPWETTAKERWVDLRRDLTLNGQEAIADRLRVGRQTPEDRAIETTQALDAPRHVAAYRELTGEEFPSSTPMQVEDQQTIVDAYEKAPAVARQPAAEPAVERPQTPEEKQATADKMFADGKDLRDIHAHTGTKPEGAAQAAWEKTEFVYGQPTALDRLQEMGKGGHAVSETGYTYAMSADGKELIRFDANLQEAGRKSVEDVQAYLHEKRGVEFDKQQEQKQEEAKQAAPAEEQAMVAEKTVEVDAEKAAQIADDKRILDERHEADYLPDTGAEPELTSAERLEAEATERHIEAAMDARDDARALGISVADYGKDRDTDLVADLRLKGGEIEHDGASYSLDKNKLSHTKDGETAKHDAIDVQDGIQHQRFNEQEAAKQAAPVAQGQAVEVAQQGEIKAAPEQQVDAPKVTMDEIVEADTKSSRYQMEDPADVKEAMMHDALDREFGAAQTSEPSVEVDHQAKVEVAPEQSAASEKVAVGELAQKDIDSELAKAPAKQLDNTPGKATSEQFSKEYSEEGAKVDNTAATKDIAEVKSEPLKEEAAKVNSEANADLRADFQQSKAAYEAKQPEKAQAQEIVATAEVEQKVETGPNADLRDDFAQSKAQYEAKQDVQPEQKVEVAENAEVSEKVPNEPSADLRADFEASKGAYEEKQSQPEPEPIVQQEQEEERERGMAFV